MDIRNVSSEDSGALGPGTDLIISLVAILVMMLAINSEKLKEEIKKVGSYMALKEKYLEEQEALEKIKLNQNALIEEIENLYEQSSIEVTKNHYAFRFENNLDYDIQIINDFHQQRITFGSNVLFDPDEVRLKQRGRELLKKMGMAIKSSISFISEIQIQGHADISKTNMKGGNLMLASKRSIAVYQLFIDKIPINPAEHLISISSFGEYKPVNRSAENVDFSYSQLKKSNSTESQRRANRRIEVILNYRKL